MKEKENDSIKLETYENEPEKKSEEPKKEEHKHKVIHKEPHRKQLKIKKADIWKTATIIFAVLFVIALFTKGFSFIGGATAKIDNCVKDIEQLSLKSDSQEFKEMLDNSKEDLITAKELIETKKDSGRASTDKVVKLDFYVMSQCPYGTQVEEAIGPVLEQIGDSVDFNLNFIANDNGDGTFRSLHGQNEVDGDIVQLCAIKYYADKYMDFILCQNKNAGAIPGNYESCAGENNMDKAKLKACLEGEEGKELLRTSIAVSQEVGASGSPTIYLNDKPYSGGRSSTDFMRAICADFTTKPQPCLELPEAVKVKIIVLNDKRCKECAVSNLMGQLKGIFPGLETKELDYNDAEGKKLYNDLGLAMLPALLFDKNVEKAEGYSNVQKYLVERGDYYELRIGATFDPTKEICDNKIDDTGDGKVDCDDPDCEGNMLCRAEIKKKLDVFVMSQCPYGVKGLDAMKEVLDNFGENIDFDIHYIAGDNGDGTFNSLHGQGEVDEDIRELCVIDLYPDDYKYMDYILCRNKDISSAEWESCASDNGMDAAAIKACSEGEKGKELLRASIKVTDSLGISASPTWLANNKVKFSGIDSETIKKNFCSANTGLDGCENTLSGDTGGVSGSC